MQRKKTFSWGWFLMGIGNSLQLVASLSMTEIYVLLAAPCIIFREYPIMRRTGVHRFFWFSILVIVGGLISMVVYNPPMYFVVRKMAIVVLVSCAIVVIHRKLRTDPLGFKWFLLGAAISLVICTFVFQQSVEVTKQGAEVEDIMSGPIFWITRLSGFVNWPARAFYLQIPIWVSCCCYMFMAVFSMIITTSGRSAALGALGAIAIAVLGGRSQSRMLKMGRSFILVGCLGFVVLLGLNKLYMTLALNGSLGEESRTKYEMQTKTGRGILDLIIGGRCDAVVPFYVCAKYHPICGFGFMPVDDRGYYVEFLSKYGAEEDVQNFEKHYLYLVGQSRMMFIPAHSCMGGFWLQYGIFGLWFWIYICYVLIVYLKNFSWAVPQWYGWLACGVPSMLWMIFFSPFAYRVPLAMFVVACLLSRAVAKGWMQLPISAEYSKDLR